MSTIQNVFVAFGVFWASLWVALLLAWPFARLNAGIVYGDSVFSALAMGVMTSMGRTVAAVLAGVLVTVIVAARKSEHWALIPAVLYVVAAPVRHHWGYPATGWDRL
jgi:hypothetical protein